MPDEQTAERHVPGDGQMPPVEGAAAAVPESAAAGAPAPTPEAPEGFRTAEAIVAEKDQEIAILKDRLLRLQAEFDNFKKRQVRERAEFLKFANENLLREFLPILDNLERAAGSASDEAQPGAIRTGLELIVRLFRTTLEKAGVSLIECQGAPFDPNTMQAVQQVESPDGTDGLVAEVVAQGYLLEGRVLRPAMVKVFRTPRSAETPAGPADA